MTQYLLQITLAGLGQGSLFALTALGLVMIYNASSVVNFAHGAMGMAATYVAYVLISRFDVAFPLAFAAALVAAFALGVVVQALFLSRLRNAPLLSQVVVTLGLFMLIEGLLGLAFGYNPRPMTESIPLAPVILGELVLRPQDVLELALLLILGVALAALFAATKIGLAMRAMTENPYAARLMGIPVGRVLAAAWGFGVLLSAVAAILAAPTTSVTPNMMNTIVVYGFVAAIVGGFGSMAGALVGGLILGVVVNMVDAFLAPQLAMSIVFGLLLIVLYLRPDGLLGRASVQKV